MAVPLQNMDAKDALNDELPTFPAFLPGELCWDTNTFRNAAYKYIIHLSPNDISAIERAIAFFKALGKDLPSLSPETFPLPEDLRRQLRQISTQLHDGVGFAVLRGLDPKRYNDEDNVIAYCGLASHVGAERVTNAFGMSLNHLRNAEKDPRPQGRRNMQLNASKRSGGLKFHADRYYAEIVAMFVKENAAVGGEQYLASFSTIYNRMMKEEPGSVGVLAEQWDWPKDCSRDLSGPVIFPSSGRVIVQLVWQAFVENPELLTPNRKRALGIVQSIAEEVSIELDHQAGDVQFVNNLAILHARSSFKDSRDKARHILRLGLRDRENGWTLPEQYRKLTNSAYRPVEEQCIPVCDFDPYFATTVATAAAHHG